MPTIERFEDPEGWKVSGVLTREIYKISKNDLFIRDYGLRYQIRRAAVSIMSNIAEGFKRGGSAVQSGRLIAGLMKYLNRSGIKGIKFK